MYSRRLPDGKYHNSYHIILQNGKHFDGAPEMQLFAADFQGYCKTHLVDFGPKAIDMSVYTKGRPGPSNASAARFANDARGSDKRNNARYRGFNIAATRTVRPGDGILVPYGREYWQ